MSAVVTKDYRCFDNVVQIAGKRALQVQLKTSEFGMLSSRIVEREYIDDKSDHIIWDALANELIDEYEDRLSFLKNKN